LKILLLGKNGQVGWELQRSLSLLGEVIALDRDSTSKLAADLGNPELLRSIVRDIRPQWIVNAAAYTAVDKAQSEQELARCINATSVAVLAEEAKSLNSWLVHYSTDYVFDGAGSRPWVEDDVTGPLNVYGETKLEGEKLIRESGCQYLIFRTSWVYATRGSNFAKTMLRFAKEREKISVINDQFGAPTGADFLADLTTMAMAVARQRPEVSGLYHAVAAGDTDWYGYAKHVIEFARAHGQPIQVKPLGILAVPTTAFPTPARRPGNSRMDTTKLRETFQVVPPAWQHGVDRMLTESLMV
jgi:dTDP-4-dehydrorhamnose reductase